MTLRRSEGFSLIEVTVAIGVIAFAVIAILGLVPIGVKSGREAVDATRTSLIAQDVVNRVRTSMVSNDSSSQFYYGPYATNVASFFMYTNEGARTGELLHVQYPSDRPQFYGNVKNNSDFYRAKVTVAVFDQTAYTSTSDPRHVSGGTTPNLLCATLELGWPINTQDGSVISASANKAKATYTFFIRRP